MSDTKPLTRAELEAVFGGTAVGHSERFRRVSNGYPNAVALAYGRDLERAAGDSDERVAATVAAWEREQGLEPRDWQAIGADERGET